MSQNQSWADPSLFVKQIHVEESCLELPYTQAILARAAIFDLIGWNCINIIYDLLKSRAHTKTCIYFWMEIDEIWQEGYGLYPWKKRGYSPYAGPDSSGMKQSRETSVVNFLLEKNACSMVRRAVTEVRQDLLFFGASCLLWIHQYIPHRCRRNYAEQSYADWQSWKRS